MPAGTLGCQPQNRYGVVSAQVSKKRLAFLPSAVNRVPKGGVDTIHPRDSRSSWYLSSNVFV